MIRRIIMPIACLALLVPLGASAQRVAEKRVPFLGNFVFQCTALSAAETTVSCSIPLLPIDDGVFYPLYDTTGMTIKTVLYLPGHARISWSRITPGAPRGVKLPYMPVYSDLHYRMVKVGGTMRPVWIRRHLLVIATPAWQFKLSGLPTSANFCVKAEARTVGVSAPPARAHKCFARQE